MWTKYTFIFIFLKVVSVATREIHYCCQYCRSDPKQWVDLAGEFELSTESEITKMSSPPAYLVGNIEEADFQIEERSYRLRYAGAPLHLEHEDLSDPSYILNMQYIQLDLATPKPVGGIMTQGGFYEERIQGLFPREVTWATSYVISYSNTTESFAFYRTWDGIIKVFDGNEDHEFVKLNQLETYVTSRYVRFHPLRGKNKNGGVSNINVRVAPVVCSQSICVMKKVNCLMTSWGEWSTCKCSGSACTHRRKRSIVRIQACGGTRCGSLNQIQTCVPPEPLWRSIIQYTGIGLAVIVSSAVIGLLIFRKTQKDRVEVILVKENDGADVRVTDDIDLDDNEKGDVIKDFEGREMQKANFPMRPQGAPPPYTEAPRYN